MLPLIFVTLGKYIQEMLLQYATKRFGWSWSKVHRPLPPTPYPLPSFAHADLVTYKARQNRQHTSSH